MLACAKRFPRSQRKLIINGDVMDLPSFMQKNLNRFKPATILERLESVYIPEAKAAFDWTNALLDKFQLVYPEIFWLDGNHDWRLHNFSKNHCPGPYKPYFNLKENLGLDKRNIKHIKYNYWLDIGKISITHGMYHGSTALKKHWDACGQSVIFGHIHNFSSQSFICRGDTQAAWSLPCASTVSPEWTRDSENNWSNGFGELFVRSSGKFNFYTMNVIDGVCIHPSGKLYESP